MRTAASLLCLLALGSIACGGAQEEAAAPANASPAPAPTSAARPTPNAADAGARSDYRGHGRESVSPEVLQKFAPGPLEANLSRRIQAMLDVRGPGAGFVLPGGKGLVFSWTVTGTSQVYRLDGPQRFPVQLTGGEDVTAAFDVTPDGKTLILTRDRKGEEYPGIYLQDVAGGPLRVVLHAPKVQARPHHVSADGKYLYFSANDKKPDSYAVYRYDLKSGARDTIFAEDGLWAVDDAKGKKLLLGKATGALWREVYELDLDTKANTPVIGQGEKEEHHVRYGAGEDLLVVTNKLGEFRRLYRGKRGDGKVTLEPASPEVSADVMHLVIDEARTRVLYNLNEGGYTRLRALDARTLKDIKVPEVPGADHVRAVSLSRDGRFATLLVRTTSAPAIPYVLELGKNKLERWAQTSAPEVDSVNFVPATLEHFVARDGTKLPMFVRRPKACAAAAEPCPVIVHFHGGPEGQSLPGFSAWAQLVVDAGFVWVDPNVRGSDGYGKSWLRADDGAKRLEVITDLEDTAKHVRSAFTKNGKAPRVGVVGGSYGGYSTLMAMTRFAGSFDAGVSIVGIANLLTFLENTAPYRRALRATEYGDPVKDRDTLIKLSPVTYVAQTKAPLLLIQGVSDPRVPAGEAIQMFDALSARSIPTGLVLFGDEGHGTQKRENRVLEIGHALRFLSEHLKSSAK